MTLQSHLGLPTRASFTTDRLSGWVRSSRLSGLLIWRGRKHATRYLDQPVPVQIYEASSWLPATAVAVRVGGREEQVLLDLDDALHTRLGRWVDRTRLREPPPMNGHAAPRSDQA